MVILLKSICHPQIQARGRKVMDRYEIIIYWSDEDKVYDAEVPELPGCSAHGDSYESALNNAKEAIVLWIETAKEFDDPIPEPKCRRLAYA